MRRDQRIPGCRSQAELRRQVAKVTPEDANEAAAATYAAFDEGPCSRMQHEQRAKIMFRIADLMDARREEFALLGAMDMGMPYRLAKSK